MTECCVCFETKKNFSNCKNGIHVVCKDCIIKTAELCFCNSPNGEFIYSCPICRSVETGFSDFLKRLSANTFFRLHETCSVCVEPNPKIDGIKTLKIFAMDKKKKNAVMWTNGITLDTVRNFYK